MDKIFTMAILYEICIKKLIHKIFRNIHLNICSISIIRKNLMWPMGLIGGAAAGGALTSTLNIEENLQGQNLSSSIVAISAIIGAILVW